jgi:hypothetical protein
VRALTAQAGLDEVQRSTETARQRVLDWIQEELTLLDGLE